MKIAVNALAPTLGGGVTYMNELLRYVARIDRKNEYVIFVTRQNKSRIVDSEIQRDSKFLIKEVEIGNVFYRLFYEQFVLPLKLVSVNAQILYSPSEIATLLAPCKVILGVQNYNPYCRLENVYPLKERFRFKILGLLGWSSMRKARKILFGSDTLRQHVVARFSLNVKKTEVIHYGVDCSRFDAARRHRPASIQSELTRLIGGDYILCLSSLGRSKNIETLIQAYAWTGSEIQRQYKLAIVGQEMSPGYLQELENLALKLRVSDRVVFTGFIANALLPYVYTAASLFVLPSFLENWAFPILEAMASGVPVIASTGPALPEEVGDAGILFDPANPVELERAIVKVLSDPNYRRGLIDKSLFRAQQFSWEKCAGETLAVFEEVLSDLRSSVPARTGNAELQ